MSTIIAIETSTELASAALLHDGRILSLETSGVQNHSQTILPMVQQLLAQAGIALARCDAIAFGAGPGSFTGVRTACGIAQGLAFGLDVPAVPVMTLEAMAQACRDATGAADVLSVLDARMGEVYWAQYRFDGEWRIVTAPRLSSPADVSVEGPVLACGNGLAAYAEAFAGRPFMPRSRADLMPHARQVAQLANAAFARGEGVPAHDAQPVYLRNKVALTTSERQAKAPA
jgi:tRNA threonylcarbamoyladenosine biosynthesis protein TsaB